MTFGGGGLFEGVGIALASLRSSKARAALTILGIAIGVMVVMLMAALISGINKSVAGVFESIAPRTFLVWRFFQAGVNVSDGSDESSPCPRNGCEAAAARRVNRYRPAVRGHSTRRVREDRTVLQGLDAPRCRARAWVYAAGIDGRSRRRPALHPWAQAGPGQQFFDRDA